MQDRATIIFAGRPSNLAIAVDDAAALKCTNAHFSNQTSSQTQLQTPSASSTSETKIITAFGATTIARTEVNNRTPSEISETQVSSSSSHSSSSHSASSVSQEPLKDQHDTKVRTDVTLSQ